MASPDNPRFQAIPRRFALTLAVASGFVAFITVDQSHWWALKPDYAFGWLVPILVVFLMAERWRSLGRVMRTEGPSPISRALRLTLDGAAGVSLGLGLLVFLFGSMYRAGEGPSQPGSFALAAGFAGILLGMVYFNAPDGRIDGSMGRPGWAGLGYDARFRACALFLFPALIWMVSAPLVTAVENALSLFLLHRVVEVVFTVFGFLGLPLLRQGNILILPHGQVGVAEACSGIRSLTGCLFAGSFLAAVFLDRLWKKALLVLAAMALAFLSNLARSLFLTSWAYAYGSDAIEGRLHDGTGFAVLILTCIGLFCLLPLFSGTNWSRWLGLAMPVAPSTAER